QLVDPLLVLETQPRRLSAAEPLGQLGLDPLPNPLLDRVGTHGHAATAGAAAGATARASSASGLRAALAPSGMRARMGSWKEHTSELQSPCNLVCRLLLEKK